MKTLNYGVYTHRLFCLGVSLLLGSYLAAQTSTGTAFADLSVKKATADPTATQWKLTATVGNYGGNSDSRNTKALIMVPGNVRIISWSCDIPSATFTQHGGYVLCDIGSLCRCNHPSAINRTCRYKATIKITTTKDPSNRENFAVLVYNDGPDVFPQDNYWVKKPGTSPVADCKD